ELTGASVYQSGAPSTIASGVDNSRTGIGSDRAIYTGVSPDRPDGVDPTLEWFNPAAYAVNPVGTYGTLGKGTLRQPGSFNWDMGLFKNIKITERYGVPFRSEFFNVLNTTNLGTAGTTVNTTSSFGRITTAGDPRIMQFSLKLTY